MNITVIIPAFNEEKSLPLLKKSLKDFKKIILIDNYSTDNTYKLASSFGWETYKFRNKGFSEDPDLIKFYLSKINTDWIYVCRADEIPSKKLCKILNSKDQSNFDAIRIVRRNFLNNRRCHTWGLDYETPIFRKKFFIPSEDSYRLGYAGTFINNTRIKTFSEKTNIYISHYIDYTPNDFFNAINKYSTIWSKWVFTKSNKKNYAFEETFLKNKLRVFRSKIYRKTYLTFAALFLMPPLRFFYHYFIKGGIRSGLDGFISSCLMACEEIMIALKCLAIQNKWPV